MKPNAIFTAICVALLGAAVTLADETPPYGEWELLGDNGVDYYQSALLRLTAPAPDAFYTASVHQDGPFSAQYMHKSEDGGRTWQVLFRIEADGTDCGVFKMLHMVLDVAFWDAMNGVRGGFGARDWCFDALPFPACLGCVFLNGAEAFYTTDGGQTWNEATLVGAPQNGSLTAIQMLDSQFGYAGGQQGSFFRTTDGGRTWEHLGNPDPSEDYWNVKVQSVQFLDLQTGFIGTGLYDEDVEPPSAAAGDAGAVLAWTIHQARMAKDPRYRMEYLLSHPEKGPKGLLGKVLKTTDGGQTWTVLRADDRKMFTKVYFVNEQTGFAIGESFQHATDPLYTLIRTTDGGQTWEQVDLPAWQDIPGLIGEYWLFDIKFKDENLGFIVGDGQGVPFGRTVILYTLDGGETWDLDPFEDGEWDPLDIEFLGKDAWVVGQAFMTLHYQGANAIPIADAGPDQTVPVGTLVQLDGTGSYDPDGDPLDFIWSQPGGPGVLLDDSTSAAPSFTADEAGTLTFELVVTDGEAVSEPDRVTIEVVEEGEEDDDTGAEPEEEGGDDGDGNGCGC